MKLLTKLFALFRRPAPVITPASLELDSAFLEAVAKRSRERLAQRQPSAEPDSSKSSSSQLAA